MSDASLPCSQNLDMKSISQEQIFQLQQAFKQFSLETSRLEMTYHSLQEQFKMIQDQLQETRTKLHGKLAELDFVTSYLNTILHHMSQGILFIDLNGIVTTYSLAAQNILGIPETSVLFHPFANFFSDEVFGFSIKEALLSKQCPKTSFTSWKTSDGSKVDLEIEATFVTGVVHVSPIAASTQPPIQGLLILMRNITEIRRLQTLANRHDRLKDVGEMAALVAHEIRNPLGGIKGFATLLHQDLKGQPHLQQMAHYIIEGTNSLSRFVSRILDYTRPFQPQLESVDLISFMQKMAQLIQADHQSSQVTYVVHATVEILNVPIDRELFKSAVLNLLVNAVQAMPQGGVLSIDISQDKTDAIIHIQDTGIGIAEDHLEKIFSPFFTTKDSGNGLGLAEVHKVIQAHRGTIEVYSQLGQGTVFTVRIPLKIS